MSLVSKLMQVVARKNKEVDFNLSVVLKGQFAVVTATNNEGVQLHTQTGKVAFMVDLIDSIVDKANKVADSLIQNIDLMSEAINQGKTVLIYGVVTLLRINKKTVTVQDDATGKKRYMDIEVINKLGQDEFDILYREVA